MNFYLVQRLERAYEGNNKKGFDHHFSLEYMGSAEYEFRTPYQSLQRMREKPLIVFHHEVYSCRGKELPEPVPVFFVAAKKGLLEKVTAFSEWLDRPRSKEPTYFDWHLLGETNPDRDRTVAWWSFSDDIAWALDPNVAQDLALAFQPGLASKT